MRRLKASDAGGIHRMQVQHHPHLRQALVDLPVNRPRRGVDVRSPGAGFIIGVQQQQVAGADTRKVFPFRIQQEFFAVRRDGRAKVVGHRFVHPEMGDDTKGRRQVDARLFFIRAGHVVTPLLASGFAGPQASAPGSYISSAVRRIPASRCISSVLPPARFSLRYCLFSPQSH